MLNGYDGGNKKTNTSTLFMLAGAYAGLHIQKGGLHIGKGSTRGRVREGDVPPPPPPRAKRGSPAVQYHYFIEKSTRQYISLNNKFALSFF